MKKKKNPGTNNGYNTIVFSTDPSFGSSNQEMGDEESLQPSDQKLKILLDKKQRGGKMVTLVTGYIGKHADLEDLGKQLKTYCGTGGSVKDYEIIVQGDQRDKVVEFLKKKGFVNSKKI